MVALISICLAHCALEAEHHRPDRPDSVPIPIAQRSSGIATTYWEAEAKCIAKRIDRRLEIVEGETGAILLRLAGQRTASAALNACRAVP